MKNIEEKLLKRLRSRKSITPLQALNLWGSFRIASYINRLRKKGHRIKTEIIRTKTSIYAKYTKPHKEAINAMRVMLIPVIKEATEAIKAPKQ